MCSVTSSSGIMKRARPASAATSGGTVASSALPTSPPNVISSKKSAVPKTSNARRRAPPPSPALRIAALFASAVFFVVVLAIFEYEAVTYLFGPPSESARSYMYSNSGHGDDDDRIRPPDGGSRLRGRVDDAAVGVDEGSVSITSSSNSDPTQGGVYEPISGQSSRIPRPIVIAGPSGVGKGTLINKLLEHYTPSDEDGDDANKGGDYFGFSVSHTTRGSRPGEVDGVHYHFRSRQDVQAGIDNGDFIEYNEVHGNLYGTSFDAVNSVARSGRIAILDIDVQGVKRVKKKKSIDPYYIFTAPPSMAALEKRLRDRGTESEDSILIRSANARAEVEYGQAPNNFDFIVVNDDLDAAFKRLLWQLRQVYPHLPASVR